MTTTTDPKPRRGLFVMAGIVLWLAGVAVIRLLGPVVHDGGVAHMLFWAANVAAGALTIVVLARVSGRSRHAMVVPAVTVAMPAMLMDGVAVTLDTLGITHIYADTPAMAAFAGGTLLFAFWSALFFALLWHRPRAS